MTNPIPMQPAEETVTCTDGHHRKRPGPGGSDAGSILILAVLSLPVLLGIVALSIDATHMYDVRNRLYAAADAAAKTGAIEVLRNPSISSAGLTTFADQQVVANGFDLASTTVVVRRCNDVSATCDSPFTGDSYYVEAILSQETSTSFAQIIGFGSMVPGARAIAGSSRPSNCLTTQQGLTIGNTELTLSGCGVAVGGNLSGTNPNAAITGTPTPSVAVTGTCSGTCSGMGALTTGAAFPEDPLASLVAPSNPGGCVPGTASALSQGCYTSITVPMNTTTTLAAGTYYITGPINVLNHGILTGTGVTLYLTGSGSLNFDQNSTLQLTAPGSGDYTGIAIFQDATDTNNFSALNSFTLDVTGAIYMPGVDVSFVNHLTFVDTTCSLFLAKSLTINNGSGALDVSGCAGAFAGAAFLSVSVAE